MADNDVDLKKEEFSVRFVDAYGPSATLRKTYPIQKKGIYRRIPFVINETRSRYSVTVNGKTRSFSSALSAGRWVYNEVNTLRLTENPMF